MSADNWTTCPKCLAEAKENHRKQIEKLKSLYGKIPQGEYDKKRSSIGDFDEEKYIRDACKMNTRENWEIGIEGNYFRVYYKASCNTCRFKFSHEFKEKIITQSSIP